jgi:hypothetical protein
MIPVQAAVMPLLVGCAPEDLNMSSITVTNMVYVGRKRVFFAERDATTKKHGLRVQGDKWHWYATLSQIDTRLKKLRAEYGKGKRAWGVNKKYAEITCACGCGKTSLVEYVSRPPKFINDEHRRAADRDRRYRARCEKQAARILEEQKRALRNAARKAARSAGSRSHAGGVEGESAREGEGASPSRARTRGKGLFSDQPEPKRSAKRKASGLPVGGEE